MLEQIIERLRQLPKRKDTGDYNGGYEILRRDVEHYRENTDIHDFYAISGFLWGLHTAEIITESECKEAHDEIIAI